MPPEARCSSQPRIRRESWWYPAPAEVEAEVVAVAHVNGDEGVTAGVRGSCYAIGVNNGDLNDDFTQYIRGICNRHKARRVLSGLDAPPQIEQSLVYFADRPKHVLLEYDCKIMVRSLGFLATALDVFNVFETDPYPQYDNDNRTENRGTPPLGNQTRHICDMKRHWHGFIKGFSPTLRVPSFGLLNPRLLPRLLVNII